MPLEPNKQLKATVYGIIVIIYDAAAVADRRVFYDKQGSVTTETFDPISSGEQLTKRQVSGEYFFTC